MKIRDAKLIDTDSIIKLINKVYQKYGDKIFLDGVDSDLLNIEQNYNFIGGKFVVLESNNIVIGTHAVLPDPNRYGVCLFKRLYTEPELWGTGAGNQLMQWAFTWAKEHKMQSVEFWSDIRFERAHKFFEKWNFIKGETRQMSNGSMPYEEYFFSCNLE